MVVEYFISYEVVDTKSAASLASGITKDTICHRTVELTGQSFYLIPWLFEKRHSKQVQKWSGTNDHPSWVNNKLGNIITVFTHFAYHYSAASIILADIQSTC